MESADVFDFTYLKQYIILEGDVAATKLKHTFYKLDSDEILEAESRLQMSFPEELRDFYKQVGYGFLCNTDKNGINRIMDPASVADFILGEDIYEFDSDRELYLDDSKLVFFEISEGTYLTMDLLRANENGQCPIYYFDSKIADTLGEFLKEMNVNTDYYL